MGKGIKTAHFASMLEVARTEAVDLQKKIFAETSFAAQTKAWRTFDEHVKAQPIKLRELAGRINQPELAREMSKFPKLEEWQFFERILPKWSTEHEKQLQKWDRDLTDMAQKMMEGKHDAKSLAKIIYGVQNSQNALIEEAVNMIKVVRRHKKNQKWVPRGGAFQKCAP